MHVIEDIDRRTVVSGKDNNDNQVGTRTGCRS